MCYYLIYRTMSLYKPWCFYFILNLLVALTGATVRLQRQGSIYMPTKYLPFEQYTFNSRSVDQCAVDTRQGVYYFYCGGANGMLHIVDFRNPQTLDRIRPVIKNVGTITDVQACGNYLALSTIAETVNREGFVNIYRLYNSEDKTMTFIQRIQLNSGARHMAFAQSCRRLIVAVEGRPRTQGGFVDPEGEVAVLTFENDPGDIATVTTIDFKRYNNPANTRQLLAAGVRFPNHSAKSKQPTTFSQCLEPYDVTINKDESSAYVTLTVNNAIARIFITGNTPSLRDIISPKTKSWKTSRLDTSDADGGIMMRSWDIESFYQPNFIKYVALNGKDNLLVTNTGAYTNVSAFEDFVTGSTLARGTKLKLAPPLLASLKDGRQLGNLRVSDVDGKDGAGSVTKVMAFGGRSLSLLNTENAQVEWDSGDNLEEVISSEQPQYFNSISNNGKTKVTASFDKRSPFEGPRPECMDSTRIGTEIVAVIGIDNPGFLAVYTGSLETPNLEFTFQSLQFSCNDESGRDDTWEKRWQSGSCWDLDPEDIIIIPEKSSPVGTPLVAVSSATTGSVSFFAIVDQDSDKLSGSKNFVAKKYESEKHRNVHSRPIHPSNILNQNGFIPVDKSNFQKATDPKTIAAIVTGSLAFIALIVAVAAFLLRKAKN